MLVIAAVVYIRMRRHSGESDLSGPTNFEAVRNKLFEDVGFGRQYNVNADEIGLALTLSWLPIDSLSGRPELTPEITSGLLFGIKETVMLAGNPQVPVIHWESAKVHKTTSDNPPQVTVVVKQSGRVNSNTIVSDIVLGLMERAIASDELIVGRVRVTSAALMLLPMFMR